ncbi:2-dehydropantoate 2-reductase [Phytomonospora endophytica]|uniref:2-dehydropantoate 2-reductase n=1 Tax=Phytomonospora endophytica TaxID=714109 RepID=A0A841FMJ7_9ACTN|nr:2-dehydropantoate 2-reductase [Phytomonospora endophytica]MBB6034772.1 2-dehydropantoate 2-reductase [Phytomonospora endophytica]
MRIAVIGAGGIGGYFGGRLAVAGHEVALVARGEHLAALRRDGLTVDSPKGDFTLAPAGFTATGDTGEVGPVDVVLLCVKTWQLDEAVKALPPLMGPGTAVITLQNGVEAPVEVAEAVGRDAVWPGTARIIALLAGLGHVRHVGGAGLLTFGEWDGRRSARVERFAEALNGAGVSVELPADPWVALWAKLLFVATAGGLCATVEAPFGVIREQAGTRAMVAAAMTEVAAVAAAEGVELPADIVDESMAFLDRQPAEGTPSLHRDILEGKRSELEAWTGSVVRLGKRTGTPTPVCAFVYTILSAREASRRG